MGYKKYEEDIAPIIKILMISECQDVVLSIRICSPKRCLRPASGLAKRISCIGEFRLAATECFMTVSLVPLCLSLCFFRIHSLLNHSVLPYLSRRYITRPRLSHGRTTREGRSNVLRTQSILRRTVREDHSSSLLDPTTYYGAQCVGN